MKKNVFQKIFSFLKSVKLAVILIIYITVTSTLATLIPQGNEIAFYKQVYNPFVSWLILSTGLHSFFNSFLFLMPVVLFIINLTVCTSTRFVRELFNKQKKRFGPDIIHIGIFILIVSSFITFFLKQEKFFYLDEGEQITVLDKYTVTLKSFKELRYPDGRPKEWISDVSIKENGEEILSSFNIEVNKPLELDGISLYQYSYYNLSYLILESNEGKNFKLPEGHPIPDGTNKLFFKKALDTGYQKKNKVIIIQERENNQVIRQNEYQIGEYIGDYLIKGAPNNLISGLQIVYDPGFLPVIISFIIILAGFIITLIQKIGDKKL